MLKLSSLVILTFCYVVIVVQADDVKYDYFYERVEQLENRNGFLTQKFDVAKSGDSTFKVKGQLKHTVTTEDMEIEMISFHSDKQDGELTETKFKGRKNICDFMKGPYKAMIYPKFKDTSNVPTPETCPLPAEEYIINETEIDVDRFKHLLKPGHWKMVMTLYKGEEIISRVAIYGHITVK